MLFFLLVFFAYKSKSTVTQALEGKVGLLILHKRSFQHILPGEEMALVTLC